jgi:uncharacterized protein YndB with AHSA1/START domain
MPTTFTATEPARMSRHAVAISRQVLIQAPPDAVFALVTAEDVLPRLLTGHGPLPGVVRTSDRSGPWDRPGSQRLVHMADGSTVREQVTRHEAPGQYAFRIWDFSHPLARRFVHDAHGTWQLQAVQGGTRVAWTYSFHAVNALAAIPLAGVGQTLWRNYMEVCLANVARLLLRPSVE